MATTVVTTQTDRPQDAGCRDNSTPVGAFGCDKRTDPNCCLKFFCPFWTVLNWDGCGVTALLAFLFECWFVVFCWQPQIWGRTYYRQPHTVVVGQPVAAPTAPVAYQQQTVVHAGDFDSDSEDDILLV